MKHSEDARIKGSSGAALGVFPHESTLKYAGKVQGGKALLHFDGEEHPVLAFALLTFCNLAFFYCESTPTAAGNLMVVMKFSCQKSDLDSDTLCVPGCRLSI